MSNSIFNLLLQAATKKGGRFIAGNVDDVLRAIPLPGKAQLQRSLGAIEDTVVRPVSKWSQNTWARPIKGSSRTFIPGASGSNAVRQNIGRNTPVMRSPASYNNPLYTQTGTQRFAQEFGGGAARQVPQPSLQSSTGFSLDNPLTRTQGAFRKLQNFGPTALNPLAGGNASTWLGKVGQTINPLNPMNAPASFKSILIN